MKREQGEEGERGGGSRGGGVVLEGEERRGWEEEHERERERERENKPK